MNYNSRLPLFFIVSILLIRTYFLQAQADRSRQKAGRELLKKAESSPRIIRGAPYPAVIPPEPQKNLEIRSQIIPTGKLVGDMKPANKAIYVLDGR